MGAYYDILIEYWKEGKINEAVRRFGEWEKEGLLSKEEVEEMNKKLPDLGELLIQALDEKPEAIYYFYHDLKNKRQWDDEMLCEKLKISKKDAENIKRRKPISKKIRYRIFSEWLKSLE